MNNLKNILNSVSRETAPKKAALKDICHDLEGEEKTLIDLIASGSETWEAARLIIHARRLGIRPQGILNRTLCSAV